MTTAQTARKRYGLVIYHLIGDRAVIALPLEPDDLGVLTDVSRFDAVAMSQGLVPATVLVIGHGGEHQYGDNYQANDAEYHTTSGPILILTSELEYQITTHTKQRCCYGDEQDFIYCHVTVYRS
jgi:hypothetical protein